MQSAMNILPLGGNKSREAVQLLTGTVTTHLGVRHCLVHLGAQVIEATVAVSCLVEPQANDRVLICAEANQYSVLAILSRPQSADVTMNFEGNVRLQTSNGNVTVAASQEVNLVSADKIQMTSSELNVTNHKANFTSHTLDIVSNQLKANAKIAGLVAERMETVVSSALQHLKRSVRLIEESEILNAGELLQTVKRTFSLRSRHALLTAEKDVKVDGERIHMG